MQNYIVVCDSGSRHIKKYDLDTWEFLAHYAVDPENFRANHMVTIDSEELLYVFADINDTSYPRVYVLEDGVVIRDFAVSDYDEGEMLRSVKYLAGALWALVFLPFYGMWKCRLRKFSTLGELLLELDIDDAFGEVCWYMPIGVGLAVDSQDRIYVARTNYRVRICRCDSDGDNLEVVCDIVEVSWSGALGFEILEVASGDNLISNPGFETETDWTFTGDACRSDEDPRTGAYHAKLSKRDDAIQQSDIPVVAEQNYRLALHQKHGVEGALFHVEIAFGEETVRFPAAGLSYQATEEYWRLENKVTIPDGQATCSVRIVSDKADCAVLIDDVSFYLLEESIYFGRILAEGQTSLWQKRNRDTGIPVSGYGIAGTEAEAGHIEGYGVYGGPTFRFRDSLYFLDGYYPKRIDGPPPEEAYHGHIWDGDSFIDMVLPTSPPVGLPEERPGVAGLGQRGKGSGWPNVDMEVALWIPGLGTEETPPPPEEEEEPAYVGSGVVGFVREAPAWTQTPITGSDPDKAINGIIFFPCKHETFTVPRNLEAGLDVLFPNRQASHIIANPEAVSGSLTFNPGPETLGHLFTMLFGTPETIAQAAGVWSHTWRPNRAPEVPWPVPYSIESQFRTIRSKLIQGAVLAKLAIYMDNNAAFVVTGDWVGKRAIWLYPDADDEHGSGTVDESGNTRPARMSAIDVIDEPVWHFRQLAAYPQLRGVDEQGIVRFYLEFLIPINALFTGGSAIEPGTYSSGIVKASGRCATLFRDEATWELWRRGTPFAVSLEANGDMIDDVYRYEFSVNLYSCRIASPNLANRVGDLVYDFSWMAARDPNEGMSCQLVLQNKVESYA